MGQLNMAWRWPWALVIAAVTVCIVITIYLAYKARRTPNGPQARIYGLEQNFETEYSSNMFRTWKNLNRLASTSLIVALVLSMVLTARPSHVGQEDEQVSSRDIILCLDVSPSMLAYDHTILSVYQRLSDDFKGERIGLSLFNSTSRTLFPLTDDYALVSSQLTRTSDILGKISSQDKINSMDAKTSQEFSDLIEGTQNRKDVTSLIGDGLVSCASMLPGFTYGKNKPQNAAVRQRPRSIVLATDNVSGKSTYSLSEALKLTDEAGIHVDGMYSGARQSQDNQSSRDMKREIESHGGTFTNETGSSDTVEKMADSIRKRQAHRHDQARKAAMMDTPGWWTLALAIILILWLAAAWRLKR